MPNPFKPEFDHREIEAEIALCHDKERAVEFDHHVIGGGQQARFFRRLQNAIDVRA